jgi:hypothetical protein
MLREHSVAVKGQQLIYTLPEQMQVCQEIQVAGEPGNEMNAPSNKVLR